MLSFPPRYVISLFASILKFFFLSFKTTKTIRVIIIAIIVLIYVNRKDVILKSALYIVAKVEEEWGSDMGKIKFAEAYTYLKAKYPIITFFLPQTLMTKIIEDALVKLKEILASKASKEEKLKTITIQ